MKIIIGNDHTGVKMKNAICNYLQQKNYEVHNVGTDTEEPVDYPDYGLLVAKQVVAEKDTIGILICGTGIGISIAANKVPHARAALCYETTTAQLARQHNNANILALGARQIASEKAILIVEAFLNSSFDGERHQHRVHKLDNIAC